MKNLIATAILLGALAAPASASAPNLLTYQGRLLESGLPVSGTRSVRVQLCDALTGGACYDTGTQSVAVQNGVFRTTFTLVTTPALPGFGLASGTWHLEVSINGTPLSPREQLSSSPYAVFASSAETLSPPSANSPGVTISTNVGVGTAPSAPLHVLSAVANGARLLVESSGAAGNPARVHVRGGPASSGGQLELDRADSAGVSYVEFQEAAVSKWQVRHESGANARLDVAETVGGLPTARLTAAAGGRIGVGVTAPTARLHVSSAAPNAFDALFKVSSGTGSGQEILTVGADGILGIGTTQALQVPGTGPRLEVNGPANVVGQLSVGGGSGFPAAVTVNGTVSLSGAVNLVGVGSALTNSGNGGIDAGSGGLTTSGNVSVTGAGTFSGDGSGLTSVVRLVSSATLSGAAGSMTLSMPGSLRYLKILVRVAGLSASGNLQITFNGDTASNYAFSRLTGATLTTGASQSNLQVYAADYGTSAVNLVIETPNNVTGVKSGSLTATDFSGATAAPGMVQSRWIWADIGSAIASVTVTATAGNLLSGTSIAAYGSN